MKGSNKNRRDWFGYLMNFVAVCLGIVITFAGQGRRASPGMSLYFSSISRAIEFKGTRTFLRAKVLN